MSNTKLLAITRHEELKIGNIQFQNPVLFWRRSPLEESAFTNDELADFHEFLSEIGIECLLDPDRVMPCIKLTYQGAPIYGHVAQAQSIRILPDATEEEIASVSEGVV